MLLIRKFNNHKDVATELDLTVFPKPSEDSIFASQKTNFFPSKLEFISCLNLNSFSKFCSFQVILSWENVILMKHTQCTVVGQRRIFLDVFYLTYFTCAKNLKNTSNFRSKIEIFRVNLSTDVFAPLGQTKISAKSSLTMND